MYKLLFCVIFHKYHSKEDELIFKDIENLQIPKNSILDIIILTNSKTCKCKKYEIVFVENKFSGALINKGLEIAMTRHYDYFFKADADDHLLYDRIIKQFNFIQLHPDKIYFSSGIQIISEKKIINTRIYPSEPKLSDYILNRSFANCSLAVNLKNYTKATFTNGKKMEDKEFFSEKATFTNIINQPDILVKYKLHQNSRGDFKTAINNFKLDFKLIRQMKPLALHLYSMSFIILIFRVILPIRICRNIRDNFFHVYKD